MSRSWKDVKEELLKNPETRRAYEREEQIKKMVDRFLAWRLPEDFEPDAGISYEPLSDGFGMPTGTNLLTATQAEAMIRHLIEEG